MFDDKITRMLGTRTTTPLTRLDPNEVTRKMAALLDKLPEVKKAQGAIVINFDDGTKRTLQLNYRS